MPTTTVKGGKVKGEGRVISINAKYGFLAAQGINSKVFIIPSSLKLEAPFPPLTEELHVDDLVTFEAIEQAERNGARYLAVDGSVKLKQRGKDVMIEGEGKIVRLDVIRGCFGFIESSDVGSVFFNISAVRPATTDVTKILKLGQKVKFRALPNLEQPNCKWRASIVCAMNKAGEFLHPRNNSTSSSGVGILNSSTSVNSANNISPSADDQSSRNIMFSMVNHNHLHRIGSSADARPKSSSFGSSSCASSENIAVRSSPEFNSSFNDSANFELTHHRGGADDLVCNNGHSKDYLNDLRPSSTTYLTNDVFLMNGADGCSQYVNNGSSKSNNSCSSFFEASTTPTFANGGFGVVGESNNSGVGGIRSYQQKNNGGGSSSMINSVGGGSSWPTNCVDSSVNPAAMWDIYLEQQQKALTQNFNPFIEVLPSPPTALTATNVGSSPSATTKIGDEPKESTNYNQRLCNGSSVTHHRSHHQHHHRQELAYSKCAHLHNNGQHQQQQLVAATNGFNGQQKKKSTDFDGVYQSPLSPDRRETENIAVDNFLSADDSICHHIKKLVHELSGICGDECKYCLSEDAF